MVREHLDANLEELETRIKQQRATLDQSVEQSLQGLDSRELDASFGCSLAPLTIGPVAVNDTIRHTSKSSAQGMDRLNVEAAANLNVAKDRIIVAKEDIKVVSQAVLTAVSSKNRSNPYRYILI